jgi:hypothetical protein
VKNWKDCERKGCGLFQGTTGTTGTYPRIYRGGGTTTKKNHKTLVGFYNFKVLTMVCYVQYCCFSGLNPSFSTLK